ncbi:hypothetical protein QQP08_027782, partial [Theobroma cacao]
FEANTFAGSNKIVNRFKTLVRFIILQLIKGFETVLHGIDAIVVIIHADYSLTPTGIIRPVIVEMKLGGSDSSIDRDAVFRILYLIASLYHESLTCFLAIIVKD